MRKLYPGAASVALADRIDVSEPKYDPKRFTGFAAFVPDGDTSKARFIYMEADDSPEEIATEMLPGGVHSGVR